MNLTKNGATVRRFGAHTSIAGAIDRGASEAVELGATAFQIFSRSPRIWRAAPIDEAAAARFRALREEHDLRPALVHASYLLNLAAADPEVRRRSVAGFREELERASPIGADAVVLHPGSAKDGCAIEARERFREAFAEAVEGFEWDGLGVLLENTAGGGGSLGCAFDELAELAESCGAAAPLGFCLDTAHLFASGCDIATPRGLERTLADLDAALGLDRVRAIHFNDSKTARGSRVDRHARLGEGLIGRRALARIVNHPLLRDKPFILETPPDADGSHRGNIAALKQLMKG